MSKYRHRLPQLANSLFLTDGGLETTLIYHEHLDLPLFAAFDLLKDEAGTDMPRLSYKRDAPPARTPGPAPAPVPHKHTQHTTTALA